MDYIGVCDSCSVLEYDYLLVIFGVWGGGCLVYSELRDTLVDWVSLLDRNNRLGGLVDVYGI